MAITGYGVVSRRAGEPTQLEEIVIEPPGPGEVLVRSQASGVCHTDLHYKLGKIDELEVVALVIGGGLRLLRRFEPGSCCRR